ncbi:MAG: hypothetical protein ACHP8A_20335 [Terriglobales bacterium]
MTLEILRTTNRNNDQKSNPLRRRANSHVPTEKFYKKRSQEKHFTHRRKFSEFPARMNGQGWFWLCAPSTRYGAQPGADVLQADGTFKRAVQKELRHNDSRITLGVYAHVIGDQQRGAVEHCSARIEEFAVT